MGRYSPISLRGSLSQFEFYGRQLPSLAVIEPFAILDEALCFPGNKYKNFRDYDVHQETQAISSMPCVFGLIWNSLNLQP